RVAVREQGGEEAFHHVVLPDDPFLDLPAEVRRDFRDAFQEDHAAVRRSQGLFGHPCTLSTSFMGRALRGGSLPRAWCPCADGPGTCGDGGVEGKTGPCSGRVQGASGPLRTRPGTRLRNISQAPILCRL